MVIEMKHSQPPSVQWNLEIKERFPKMYQNCSIWDLESVRVSFY